MLSALPQERHSHAMMPGVSLVGATAVTSVTACPQRLHLFLPVRSICAPFELGLLPELKRGKVLAVSTHFAEKSPNAQKAAATIEMTHYPPIAHLSLDSI